MSAIFIQTPASAGGGGDVVGPASGTDNAIPTFNGTGGKTLKDNPLATIVAGVITQTSNNLTTTSAPSFLAQNTTAATNGGQQASPSLRLLGQGYKTNATAGSQSAGFEIYALPVQGSTSPSADLQFLPRINGSAGAAAMTLSSTGILTVTASVNIANSQNFASTGAFVITNNGTNGVVQFFQQGSASPASMLSFGSSICVKNNGGARLEIKNGPSDTTYMPLWASDFRGAALIPVQISGTNQAGTAETISGGIGTGTGIPGAVITQSGLVGSTGSTAHVVTNRGYVFAGEKTLTESSATIVLNVALATGKYIGGELIVTTHADDGTDFQAITEHFVFTAVNKAGTVTATIQAAPSSSTTAASAGTLTTAWTAVANGNGVDIKNTAVSSLVQTTLKCQWHLRLNGDGTAAVTP